MFIKNSAELNLSWNQHLNFLWQDPKRQAYIMDNHLAALWCWLKHLNVEDEYTLVHIDYHWDCAQLYPDEIEILRKSKIEKLDDFLKLRSNDGELPLVRWDNYIHPLIELRPKLVDAHFAVHLPYSSSFFDKNDHRFNIWPMCNFFEALSGILENTTSKLLLNFDLDYLFLDIDSYLNSYKVRTFSDNFLSRLGEIFKRKLGSETILTVAWSPECCGGWKEAAQACELLCRTLELECPVPHLLL